MKIISLIILTGFMSLSLFGFLGMLESSNIAHASNTCLASLAQNGACPPPGHTFASALFHTSAFKVFSTTLLSLAVALFYLALLFAGFIKPLLKSISLGTPTLARKIEEAVSQYLALQRLRLALARLEHSPTSL